MPRTVAVLLAWLAVAEASSYVDRSLQAQDYELDPLREWIVGLKIPLPSNTSGDMPMGMGVFTVRSGYCTGLKVGGLVSEDLSYGDVLEFSLRLSGFGIHCVVDGWSDGPIQINITFEESAVNASIRLNPYYSDMVEDLPLPLGPLNLTDCGADLVVTSFNSAGSGSLAEALGWMGETVVDVIGMAINEPVCEQLKVYLEVNGTETLRQSADLLVSKLLMPPSPDPEPTALKPALDWGKYPPVSVLKALLAERFTAFSDRMLHILDVTSFDSTLVAMNDVRLALSKLLIKGRGHKHLPTLEVDTHQSSLALGAHLEEMMIHSSLDLVVALPDQPKFAQQINLTFGLQQVAVGIRAMVDGPSIESLQLDEALSSPRCLAKCTDGMTDPPEEAVAIEDFHVEVQPLLEIGSAGALATDGSQLINKAVAALYKGYLRTVNALVNGALRNIIRGKLDELLWEQLDAAPACSREDMFFVLSEAGVRGLWGCSIFFAFIGVPIALLAHIFWKEAASSQSEPEAAAAEGRPSGEAEPKPLALACEAAVPRALAVYYPFAVIAVIFLFLYADLDVGTTVTMIMTADGATSKIGPLFTFSLVSTVAHAWSSGCYVIAVLTVITSGIWPFVKLFMLLITWLVPPNFFSLTRRGMILNFLDDWGKYSFLDSWFLVITLSAFALEWQSVGSASFKIQTTPANAFYTYLAATVLSLVLGHIASECHRRCGAARAAAASKLSEWQVGAGKVPLCSYAASQAERRVVRGMFGAAVVLGVLGTFCRTFSFEVSGIFAQFLFGDSIERSYSLFSVGMSVANHRYRETGLVGLEIVFIILAVAVPAVLFGLLSVLWFKPMRLRQQRHLLQACHLLNAWACLDVAALVLMIACFEFGKMAEWLVYEGNFGAPCTMVKDITKEECMKIELHAFPALTALFLAGVLLVAVPRVCMHKFQQAIQRRSTTDAKVAHPKSCPEQEGHA